MCECPYEVEPLLLSFGQVCLKFAILLIYYFETSKSVAGVCSVSIDRSTAKIDVRSREK